MSRLETYVQRVRSLFGNASHKVAVEPVGFAITLPTQSRLEQHTRKEAAKAAEETPNAFRVQSGAARSSLSAARSEQAIWRHRRSTFTY